MKKVLWFLTAGCLLASVFFIFWGLQTAWIGSLPNQKSSDYEALTMVQFGLALVFLLVPVGLWVWHWKKKPPINLSSH